MQPRLVAVRDPDLAAQLEAVLAKLASGVHPAVSEILALKPLFGAEPFHLSCLWPRHKVLPFPLVVFFPCSHFQLRTSEETTSSFPPESGFYGLTDVSFQCH